MCEKLDDLSLKYGEGSLSKMSARMFQHRRDIFLQFALSLNQLGQSFHEQHQRFEHVTGFVQKNIKIALHFFFFENPVCSVYEFL